MSSGSGTVAPPNVDKPTSQGWLKWIIAITVSFAALMEVIDTSIVNVALPDMQGNLGATLSEIGWVITGYTVANAVIIPLSAWLGDVFGRKRYFIFSLVGFVIASVLCGMSVSLVMLVVSRILQGLFGGGLLAKAQSILFETFPAHEQGLAQSIFGIGVIVGPVIGPTLGGWITDTIGWRWIFFINIPFGILAIVMAAIFLPEMESHKPKRIDVAGILLLVIFIGAFQTVLEQGQQEDWFSSNMINTLTVAAVLGMIVFIWRELTTDSPAVDLRVLRYPALAAGSIYSAILGFGLNGAMFAVPIFAQNLLHFTAMQTGMLMLPGALGSAAMMPVIGKITNKVDPRILIGLGAVGTALVMFNMASINANSGVDSLFWPLFLRGPATVLMFLPLSLATIGPLPKRDIPAASGFYNLTRQLGGSIGVAALTTILAQREAFHRSRLVDNISLFNPIANDRINSMVGVFQAKGFDAETAKHMAYQSLDQIVNTQSAVMSFGDTFWIVGIVFLCSLPLLFFLGSGAKTADVSTVH